MKKTKNVNIIKCDCGENVMITSYTKIALILFCLDVILAFGFRFIVKKMILSGAILSAYKMANLAAWCYMLIPVLFIVTVVVYFTTGGRGKCKKCLTKYKFSRSEYKNKKINNMENS